MSTKHTWKFSASQIPDVTLVEPPFFGDSRGWFSESFNTRIFAENGINVEFVQDNTSYSQREGTVRGLHYQAPPFAQAKLVRVLRGCILDVAVDIRQNSRTFGQFVSFELDEHVGHQLFIPLGFAHGFITREQDTVVSYKVSSFYAPEYDHGIYWADPDIGIGWGIEESSATLSEKDARLPNFATMKPVFEI